MKNVFRTLSFLVFATAYTQAVDTPAITAQYQAIDQQAASMKRVRFRPDLYSTPIQGEAQVDANGKVRKVFRRVPVEVRDGRWEEVSFFYFDEQEKPIWASQKTSATHPSPYDRKVFFLDGKPMQVDENETIYTPGSDNWFEKEIEAKADAKAALQNAKDALKPKPAPAH